MLAALAGTKSHTPAHEHRLLAAITVEDSGFSAGDAIEARFGGENKWCPGTIDRVAGDGTYDIAYDDGGAGKNVCTDLTCAPAVHDNTVELYKGKTTFSPSREDTLEEMLAHGPTEGSRSTTILAPRAQGMHQMNKCITAVQKAQEQTTNKGAPADQIIFASKRTVNMEDAFTWAEQGSKRSRSQASATPFSPSREDSVQEMLGYGEQASARSRSRASATPFSPSREDTVQHMLGYAEEAIGEKSGGA